MRLLLIFAILMPLTSKAAFIFEYGLNYSSETESSDTEYSKKRTYHKILLAASVNNNKTLFFGWNINQWSSSIQYGSGGDEDTYSIRDMGPRVLWFFNDMRRWYLSGEWNPYVTGKRTKSNTDTTVQGSSIGFGFGYRFRISPFWGVGAGLHYQSMSLKEEKGDDNNEATISDKVTHIMPMLEISIITK